MKRTIRIGVSLLLLAPYVALSQTRITKVSAPSLQVPPSGTAVPLTIDGVNLAGVTGVRLLKSGKPVTGVSGVLKSTLRSASNPLTSSVRLDIVATRTAPAGTYQLELLIGTQRVLAPVAIVVGSTQTEASVPVAVAAAPVAAGSVTVPAPNVSAATPATVAVMLGGPTQTVSLDGTGLNGITAVRVERNGAPVPGVQASVVSSTSSTRREVRLAATATAQPLGVPLDLILEARTGTSVAPIRLRAPVQLELSAKSLLVHRDELFGAPINTVFIGANMLFNSCDTPDKHTFTVNVANGYSAKGGVPRYESATSISDRLHFLQAHSIDPSDVFNPAQFVNLARTGHPSPITHTVKYVRMCLLAFVGIGNWKFDGATETNGSAQANVAVTFNRAHFRTRGMPAEPTGAISGLDVGILWGHPITDPEVADYVCANPEFNVQLPLSMSGGQISYGAVQVTFSKSACGWVTPFLGPSSIKAQMEQYADARMNQVQQEIRKAFESANVRNALSAAIMSRLKTAHGITNVLALTMGKADMWRVLHQ